MRPPRAKNGKWRRMRRMETHTHAHTHTSNPPTADFPGSTSDASFQLRLSIVSPLFTITKGSLEWTSVTRYEKKRKSISLLINPP